MTCPTHGSTTGRKRTCGTFSYVGRVRARYKHSSARFDVDVRWEHVCTLYAATFSLYESPHTTETTLDHRMQHVRHAALLKRIYMVVWSGSGPCCIPYPYGTLQRYDHTAFRKPPHLQVAISDKNVICLVAEGLWC